MSKATIFGVVFILALAACAPATPTEAPTLSVPVTGDTETPELPAMDVATATATPEVAVVSPTPNGATDSGSGVTIRTSTSADVSEPFLVDQEGRTLYMFATDSQNSGISACTGDCLAQWPPVIVTGTPQAGEGVNAALLGTITRDDGTMQATYNGWPLYFYVGDLTPGDTSGQGMEGVWFLVSGSGNSIQP